MLGTSLERSVPRHGLTYRGDEHRTTQDNEVSFPFKVEVVERSFSMDDSFKSVPSLLEVCSLQAGLVNLLSLEGFRLTKGISNDKDLLNAIPAGLQAQSVRIVGKEDTLLTKRALTVIWDVSKELADTRRKVIGLTESVFDPVGFLASFIVRANIFFQSLWKLRQGWDEKTPEEIQQEWSAVSQKELESLAEFSVSRFYRLVMVSPTSPPFTYTCLVIPVRKHSHVAYFRFEYPDGGRQCVFVAAKTRVAPVKPQVSQDRNHKQRF